MAKVMVLIMIDNANIDGHGDFKKMLMFQNLKCMLFENETHPSLA